jgi:Flp pilus assembly protein TadD
VETRGNQDVASYDYALYRLALSQYAQGKMPLAEATLRQAVALQPRGLGYHLALAAALKSQEKLLEARNQLEQELKLGADPETSKLLTEVNAELNAKGPR